MDICWYGNAPQHPNKHNRKMRTYILISLIWAIIIVGWYIGIEKEFKSKPSEFKPIEILRIDSLSLPALLKTCSDSLLFPEIVTAQCILESGWNLDSYASRKRNNILGIGNGKKEFNNWWMCLKYYRDHIQSRYKGGDYYDFLLRLPYASDSMYVPKLKKIVLNLEKL
jgi:hypothetical protein